MPKKLLLVVLIGVLYLSSCAPAPEQVEQPALTGQMPCTTVFDYETTPQTDQYQAVVDQIPPVTEADWIMGDPDAPITIIEYSDFQCPACQNFAFYMKALQDAFPTSIRLVYRSLPLASINPNAYISAMAAEAAGAQGMFWEMHDVLFQNLQQWSGLSEPQFIEWAVDQADSLGMNPEQFRADISDQAARAVLEERTEGLFDLGMHYTPFVVINDRVFRDNNPDILKLVGVYEFGGFDECPPWVIDPEGSYTAQLDTSAGLIEIELFPDKAPIAVNSFVFLAQNGWYEEVYFHRVIDGFVAQAGDPSGLGVIGPGYIFDNETDNDLSFDRAGVLGMANAGVNTNGSQFFITLDAATNLDGGYTIFGQVTEASLEIIEQIALRDPQSAVDFEDATIIKSIEILQQD